MDTELVINKLKELSGWLKLDGHVESQQRIDNIIAQLRCDDLTEWRRRKLKQELSCQILFHVKCLGDLYVPSFVGDGTSYAWWNYLSEIEQICQKNL